jgi:hypothetical protein
MTPGTHATFEELRIASRIFFSDTGRPAPWTAALSS